MKSDFKVAIDARWYGDTGIGRYTRELVVRAPVKIIEIDCGVGLFHPLSPIKLSSALKKSDCSAFFATGTSLPLSPTKPLVFTIHDLIPIDCPTERTLAKIVYYQTLVKSWTKRASLILTDSEFSRQRIHQLINPKARVEVVQLAASPEFRACENEGSQLEPYLIYVGNCKPHKNIKGLLTVLVILRTAGFNLSLKLSGAADPAVLEMANGLGIGDRVQFIGRLSDREIAKYYSSAVALVLPSFYEGFGLPVLEAMASGCPVICSSATSLPEVGGDAALYFDPNDIEGAAAHVKMLLNDSQYRSTLIRRGFAHASKFSWDRAAAETWEHVINSIRASSV